MWCMCAHPHTAVCARTRTCTRTQRRTSTHMRAHVRVRVVTRICMHTSHVHAHAHSCARAHERTLRHADVAIDAKRADDDYTYYTSVAYHQLALCALRVRCHSVIHRMLLHPVKSCHAMQHKCNSLLVRTMLRAWQDFPSSDLALPSS